jgi:hypothetical protein
MEVPCGIGPEEEIGVFLCQLSGQQINFIIPIDHLVCLCREPWKEYQKKQGEGPNTFHGIFFKIQI